MKTPVGAWALLFGAPAMFAANILVARLAAGWLPPLALTFWRWFFTALLACALAAGALRASWRAMKREAPASFMLGAIGMTLCGAAAYLAGEHTSAVNIGLIYAGSPVVMVLLAHAFLHEPLGPLRITGIVLCIAGIVAIVARGDLATLRGLAINRGDAWALAGSLGWAVYSFLLRRVKTELDVAVRFAWLCVAGAVAAAPFALGEWAAGERFEFSAASSGLLALTVFFASYGSYVLYARLQQMAGVAFAGLAIYLTPLFAALYGWMFVGESLRSYHLAGMSLVLCGVWLAGRSPSRPTKPS
jgi:drug/metabolite transporter (DMT)-like permease